LAVVVLGAGLVIAGRLNRQGIVSPPAAARRRH
jgi:hypothetical protein